VVRAEGKESENDEARCALAPTPPAESSAVAIPPLVNVVVAVDIAALPRLLQIVKASAAPSPDPDITLGLFPSIEEAEGGGDSGGEGVAAPRSPDDSRTIPPLLNLLFALLPRLLALPALALLLLMRPPVEGIPLER